MIEEEACITAGDVYPALRTCSAQCQTMLSRILQIFAVICVSQVLCRILGSVQCR